MFVEIFDWRRLIDEHGWNYRRRWYKPLQVLSEMEVYYAAVGIQLQATFPVQLFTATSPRQL